MTRPARDVRRREIGGSDPLDRRLGSPPASPLEWLFSLLRTRSALGLAPSLTPAVIFLPLGVALGPLATGVLSPSILARLDVVVTIALATLGVLVGIALGREISTATRMFAVASAESFATIVAVAGATYLFVSGTGLDVHGPLVVMALALGLCASASSATSVDPDSEPAAAIVTRVADLDDVLPIALAAGVFAAGQASWADVRFLTFAPVALGLAVGAIGVLLFERAESGAERAMFVMGALSLAGGAAAYLQVSPLLVGLIAGLSWTLAPGRADQIVHEDLRKAQHPLVITLLLTAGALWVPSRLALWLLAPYVLFRLVGKVAGAWTSARFVDVRVSDLAAYLMPPGVLAVAFALNLRQMLPHEAGETVLSVVAMGTAAFELFALAVVPDWRRRSR